MIVSKEAPFSSVCFEDDPPISWCGGGGGVWFFGGGGGVFRVVRGSNY